MRQLIILIILLAGYNYCTNAQTGVAINTAGTMAHNSAILDVKSDNKGMLIPRVSTSARNAINNPAAGLLVFDSTEKTIYMFDGNRWMGFQPMPDKIRPISTLVFPPNPEDTMFAGFCTSVSNEFAVVGAPYKGGLTGGAFVYRFNGDTWQHFTTLVPTSGCALVQ